KYSALPPHLNTPENHSILQPLSQQFRAYEAAARPGFGTAGRCRGAPMPKRSVLTRPMERIAADPERAVQEAPEHRVPPAQWNFQAAAHLTLGAIVPAARRGSLRISVRIGASMGQVLPFSRRGGSFDAEATAILIEAYENAVAAIARGGQPPNL